MIDKDMLEAMRMMMREEMEPIKQDLADVKQRTTKIEFTLEHDVSKSWTKRRRTWKRSRPRTPLWKPSPRTTPHRSGN